MARLFPPERELHGVGLLAGHDFRATKGLHKFFALSGTLPWPRRVSPAGNSDNSLDQFGDDEDGRAFVILEREGRLILAEFDFHVALIGEQAVQFVHRFRRHDEFAAALFEMSTSSSTSAKRRPSVATIVIL